jgi:integrase/recombinase XerD
LRRKNKISKDTLTVKKIDHVTDFDIAVSLFLKDCRIRNLSDSTLTYYKNELTGFRKLLEKQNLSTNPNLITEDIIKENVILKMMEEGRKESAINTRLRAIRAFMNWLYKQGHIIHNPVENLKLIRQKREVVQTFTREQIRSLLAQPDLTTFTGQRDLTMMMLLFETGLRVSELVNLRVDDINFEDNLIRVSSPKNYRERVVPFQSTMKRQLNKYIHLRGYIEDEPTLFLSIDNKPISIKWFQDTLRKYGRQANIKGVRVSPHTCRHTFAKMCVQSGMDVFHLQKLLGHSSLEMVRRYVELFTTDVVKEHRKHSPIEKIM